MLGLRIEPSQIRLKTNPDDAYLWERLEGKAHLFSKNISDHTVGALKELYREVGQSFHVAENNKSGIFQDGSTRGLHCPKESVSYRSRIDDLERNLITQISETRCWQGKAEFEADMRQKAEKRLSDSEGMIQVMLGDRQRLEQSVEDWKVIAEQCEGKRADLRDVVNRILDCAREVELDKSGNITRPQS